MSASLLGPMITLSATVSSMFADSPPRSRFNCAWTTLSARVWASLDWPRRSRPPTPDRFPNPRHARLCRGCVLPSFIRAIRLSGSFGETQSSFETFLSLRFLSNRRNSSSVGFPILPWPPDSADTLSSRRPCRDARCSHGRVGFQHRRIDRHRFAGQQFVLNRQIEHKHEHRLMHLQRQSLVNRDKAGMIGRLFVHGTPRNSDSERLSLHRRLYRVAN